MNIEKLNLSQSSKNSIKEMLMTANNDPINVQDIWMIVDNVWDSFKCDNRNIEYDKLNKFYSHPVWILNGLFAEQDPVSMEHRNLLSSWIVNQGFNYVMDYGGGFGTLGRLIAKKDGDLMVDIYEPYPSDYAVQVSKDFSNLNFIDNLDRQYDCIISYTTLEHVEDPLKTFSLIVSSIKEGGYVLLANDFTPVVKCHLPCTFHFRYTFWFFCKLFGLKSCGFIAGSPVTIYKKVSSKPLNWFVIRFFEKVSQLFYPFLTVARFFYHSSKK